MLEKIKSFFSPPEPEKIELGEKELKDWLDKEIKEKTEEFKKELSGIEEEIKRLKESAINKLEELEKEKIEDVRVPTRVRNKFEGKRDTFRKNIEYFFSQLPPLKAESDLEETKKNLDNALEELNENNQKPAMVLKQFFSNEVGNIGNDIKAIDNSYKKTQQIHERLNLGILKKARDDLDEYYNEQERIKNHKKNISAMEKELEELQQEKEQVKSKIQELENSQEYKKLQQQMKEKEEFENKIMQQKEDVRNNFSSVNQAIKKFARASLDEEVGNSFLESVDETLTKYDKKRILDFLGSLQKSLERGSLELKDKKRDKALAALKKIDSEFIDSFKQEIKESNKKKKKLEKEIHKSELPNKLEELNEELNKLKQKKKQKSQELKEAKDKTNKPKANTPKMIVEELNEQFKEVELRFVDK